MNRKQTVLLAILLSVSASGLFGMEYQPANYYRKYGIAGFMIGTVLSSGAYYVADTFCPAATRMMTFTQWILSGTALAGMAGMYYGAREDRNDSERKFSNLEAKCKTFELQAKQRTVESMLLMAATNPNNKFTSEQQDSIKAEIIFNIVMRYYMNMSEFDKAEREAVQSLKTHFLSAAKSLNQRFRGTE